MSSDHEQLRESRFWETKSLDELDEREWEALCDGCGRCCLNKLEDWDTGEIHFTNVACRLLDGHSCACSDYENRFAKVPDCLQITRESAKRYQWLPPSCAYRLLAEGKSLRPWHHLVSGSFETVHEVGISVRDRTVSEEGMTIEEWENHIVEWPGKEKSPK